MPRLGSLIAQSARPLYSLIATWVERHSDLWSTRFYLPGPGGDTPRSPKVCSLPHKTPASLPNTPDLLGFSVRVRGTAEVNATWNTSFCKIIVQCSICSLGIKRIFFFFLLFFFLSRGREFLKILSRNLNYFFSPDTLSGCTSLEILKDLFSKGETLKISKKMVKYNLFFFPSEEQWITKLSEFYSQESKETEVWLSGHKH